MGDRFECIRKAVYHLTQIPESLIIQVSELLENPAVSAVPQPDFLNGVAKMTTLLSLSDFFGHLQRIEREMGRREKGLGTARLIDLDLLLFGQEIMTEDDIIVPHPQMHERDFVVIPLNEVASDVVHPILGVTMHVLYSRLVWGVY